ncbi:MAG: lamin tail domain-containing protein, partial [Verrucomicrobiota bacterium]|nr:lamin tail domain-containing protein [Verrucomicrobiota bacterium]
ERIVVTNDREAFLAFYGSQGIKLANGSYDGKLDNAGERLTFVDAEENVIFSVDYKDDGRWPERADGQGSSLEAVSLQGDPSQPEHWMASRTIHGSPGSSDDARPATVLINEILSHTDPPFEDAIELYNPGTQPIDIGGWYLSDAMNNLKKYRIPMGTQIAPMGFHVAYEHQFLVQNTLAPFALSSAFGDQVYLTQADANGSLVAFADAVEFPASENGRTMGRYPDGSERWTPLDHQTLGTNLRNTDPQELISVFTNGKGAPNAAPYVGSVVFSRIMYHPTLGRDEYIEIRNRSSQVVPLYDPLYPDNTWKLEGGVAFTFPNRLVMAPQSVLLVVETDPEVFRAKYEVPSSLQIL